MGGFNDLLGIEIVGQTAEGYVLSLEIDSGKHHHDAGMVHGGVLLGLLDTVLSRTLRSQWNNAVYAPTLSISVNFFRPAQSGAIKAVGKIVNKSRSTCCVEGCLYNEEGKLLVLGTGTFFLNPVSSPSLKASLI